MSTVNALRGDSRLVFTRVCVAGFAVLDAGVLAVVMKGNRVELRTGAHRKRTRALSRLPGWKWADGLHAALLLSARLAGHVRHADSFPQAYLCARSRGTGCARTGRSESPAWRWIGARVIRNTALSIGLRSPIAQPARGNAVRR